jgi:hypothetical protein
VRDDQDGGTAHAVLTSEGAPVDLSRPFTPDLRRDLLRPRRTPAAEVVAPGHSGPPRHHDEPAVQHRLTRRIALPRSAFQAIDDSATTGYATTGYRCA